MNERTALLLKVHASNYRMVGFVASTTGEPSSRSSALRSSSTPARDCSTRPRRGSRPRPAWLRDEPGVRQCLDGRRRARDVLRRQAARRSAGGRHRRTPRSRRSVQGAPARARRARRQGDARGHAAGRARVPRRRRRRRFRSGAWRRRRSTCFAARAEHIAASVPAAKVVDTAAVAGGGLASRPRHSVGRHRDRGRRLPQQCRRPAPRERGRRRASKTTASCAISAPSIADDDERLDRRAPRRARVGACASSRPQGTSTTASRRSVLALTGTDPDRFAEEKERGLTIDLGFAFTTLPPRLDDRVRRRARPRSVRQEHARRRRRGRRRDARRRRERGLDATDRRARRHPGSARRPVRRRRADEGRPRRRRDARARAARAGRTARRHALLSTWPIVAVDALSGRGTRRPPGRARRSRRCRASRRATTAGRGCGSIASSRRAVRARSSPARSPAERSPLDRRRRRRTRAPHARSPAHRVAQRRGSTGSSRGAASRSISPVSTTTTIVPRQRGRAARTMGHADRFDVAVRAAPRHASSPRGVQSTCTSVPVSTRPPCASIDDHAASHG